MKQHNRLFGLLIAAWLVTSLACGLPTAFTSQQGAAPVAPAGAPGATAGATSAPGETANAPAAPEATATSAPSPTPTPVPNQPVSMFSGLASLDSYQSTLRMFSSGPGAGATSETVNQTQYNRAAKATRSSIVSKSSSEDSPEIETSSQDQVSVDLETCTYEDGEWSYSKMEPQEKELLSIVTHLYDVLPVISSPVFIATETKNGIAANHFSFQVDTAGAESGTVAAVNEGEYWLAVDGQYLVAYSLRLELRSGPEGDASAKVNRLEIDYSLDSVNQAIEIQLPAGCAP